MLRAIEVLAIGLVVGVASAASAQRSPRHPVPQTLGLSLGAHTIVASGITINGPEMPGEVKTNLGEGAGVQVTLGLSRSVAIFASADVAKQGSDAFNLDGNMGLAHVELGGRLSFPSAVSRLVPYVVGVVGARGLAARSDGGGISLRMRLTGTEIGVGGGFLYAFSPALALDAGVVASRGKFSKMSITGDINRDSDLNPNSSSSFRLKVGFQWHP